MALQFPHTRKFYGRRPSFRMLITIGNLKDVNSSIMKFKISREATQLEVPYLKGRIRPTRAILSVSAATLIVLTVDTRIINFILRRESNPTPYIR